MKAARMLLTISKNKVSSLIFSGTLGAVVVVTGPMERGSKSKFENFFFNFFFSNFSSPKK